MNIAYEFHEVASLLPLMNGDEFNELKNSIAKNGLIEPIRLHDGKVIDGRNRYNACRELGITPKTLNWHGNGSLTEFVMGLNVHRRHLTESQKSTIGLELLPMLEKEAEERKRSNGGDKKSDLAKSDMARGPYPISKPPNPPSIEQAATIMGIGATTLKRTKRIAAVSPESIDKIKLGEVTVRGEFDRLIETGEIKTREPKAKGQKTKAAANIPFSTALQFSTIAISQLTRITKNDPKRVEALTEVLDYINIQLKG